MAEGVKRRRRYAAAIAIVSCLLGSLQAGSLHIDGRHFKDAQGGVVMLRGFNVAGDSKVPPFTSITDETQLDPLPGWESTFSG